jgi:predicted AlkP superfamily pyrophosphatase or phosphodiesterase
MIRHLLLLTTLTLTAAPPRPRLVVVLSVDQASAELMARWGRRLPGGLGTLLRDGTSFTRAYQEHGYTETGPGHSVLMTGCYPTHTGITENSWLDAATGQVVTSVADPDCRTLGLPGAGSSARHLRVGTLGGWLLEQVPGSRSFSLTGKPRSAILMAGPKATGVFWYQAAVGFTTSTAYATALPPWLQRFNAGWLDDLRHGSLRWTALSQDPSEVRDGTYSLLGRPFVAGLPRQILEVGGVQDDAFWERYTASPFFDEAILDLASELVDAEKLGAGRGVDLLTVGLSATDYVGHFYGNSGSEMRDHLRRLDARLGRFLATLRRRVPGVWVVLTADHGGSDLAERLNAQGYSALRLDRGTWLPDIQKTLRARLRVPMDVLRMVGLQLSLVPEAVTASGLPREAVLAAAAEVLRGAPGVAAVTTATELAALPIRALTDPTARPIQERLRLSFVPGRSGDLQVALRPYTQLDGYPEVADHGSPYDYDRRVPLVFWGPWAKEERTEPVSLVDLAPTLAQLLGVKPANSVDGRPLALKTRRTANGK